MPLPEHLSARPVGQERLPRQVLEEHQRTRVVEVAAGVFAERGYWNTTVDHLVAAAQVGVGSFYSLFGGKEECFLAVFEAALESAEAELAETLAKAPDKRALLSLALVSLLDLIVAEPSNAKVILVEAPTASAAIRERYEALVEHAVRAFMRTDISSTPDRPKMRAEFLVRGIAWTLAERLRSDEARAVPGLLPDLVNFAEWTAGG